MWRLIKHTGLGELNRDIDNLKAALDGVDIAEALPVVAPASAIPDRKNEYFPTDEECVVALAEALRTEYRAIVDAGLLLQVDDARAAVTYDRMVPPASFEEYYKWVERHVDLLNDALEGIPEVAFGTISVGAVGRVPMSQMFLSKELSISS